MSGAPLHLGRTGLGVRRNLGGFAPVIALASAGLAITAGGPGDIRVGVFPWAMALAALSLAFCALVLLGVHGPAPHKWVRFGAWWTSAAFVGIMLFFVAIGIGGVLGLDEASLGVLAWPPVMAMGFGLMSMTPALLVLAIGVTRASVLPRSGANALWIAAPVLPVLLILGGLLDGRSEAIAVSLLLAIFGVAWLVVGMAIRPLGTARDPQPDRRPT